MCCACGGGSTGSADGGGDDGGADGGDTGGDDGGDDCVNDDSTSDSYGDTCTSWYDANTADCLWNNSYNDDDFNACDQCCACADAEGCIEPSTCEDQGLVTCPLGECAASADECAPAVYDCDGIAFDNNAPAWSGDAANEDGSLVTVYDCIIDNGSCEDVAGNCYDDTGAFTGEFTCPDGVIGSYTNDSLCDDGTYGFNALCLEMCFDNGGCAEYPADPDCYVGDNGPSCAAGDANGDGTVNVTDIVAMVAYVLGNSDTVTECADANGDGTVNVTDIVATVSIILGSDARSADASSAEIIKSANSAKLKADGFVGAVQMTLSHGDDFSITLADDAMVADYKTTDNMTTLIIVSPASEELFTTTGSFDVAEMIVANSNGVIDVTMATPEVFGLSSAYPNPFNPTTSVALSLPNDGYVSVTVYNVVGQTVATLADGYMTANVYDLTWNASSVPSGIYFIQAEAAGQVGVQKVMLLK